MTTMPILYQPRRRALPALFGEANMPLLRVAAICAAAIPLTLLALAYDSRVLDDEALWLKPLKFQLSLGWLAATVALVPLAFGPGAGRSGWVRWPAAATAAAMLYEIFFLALQAGRGVRSHFNDATLFDALGGTIMAAGAGVLVTGPAVIGVSLMISALRAGQLTPLRLAIGLGLLAGGLLGAVTGSALGANGGPFVGVYDPAAPVWPLFGWSRSTGDLRPAHFLALHMMQGLPLLGWLAGRALPPAAGLAAVLAAASGWVWLTLAVLAQAQAGLPLV